MALFSMKLENLQQLFVKELRDLYDAENQITEALPKMIDAAHQSELKSALQQHLQVTKQQISRLEQIFQKLNQKPTGETCKGMKGVIKEGEEIVSAGGDPARSTPASSVRRSGSSTTRWPATVPCALMPNCSDTKTWLACCNRPSMRKRKPTRHSLKLPAT